MKSDIKTKAAAAIAAAALAAGMMPMAAFAAIPSVDYSGVHDSENPEFNKGSTYLSLTGDPYFRVSGTIDETDAKTRFCIQVPTQINYVLGTGYDHGKILGPDNVHVTNYSGIPVYVNTLDVWDMNDTLDLVDEQDIAENKIYIHMNGDSLSKFQTEGQREYTTPGKWNLPATGNLDITTGGKWDSVTIDPTQDTQIGRVMFNFKVGSQEAQ